MTPSPGPSAGPPGRAALLALALVLAGCAAEPTRRPRVVPADHNGEFTTWWSDEIVKEHGTYEAGQRNGEIEVFHKEGGRHYTGEFVAGKPEGTLTTWHEDGTLASVAEYKEGVLDGSHMSYAAGTGDLIESAEYRMGRRHGQLQQWRAGGAPTLEAHFEDDLPVGRWRHWDPIGRLVREERYWVVGGEPAGRLETMFASNGEVSVQTLLTRHGDEWSGWQTTWHDNGRQASLVELLDGRTHGRDAAWDRTGRLVSEGRRAEGKRVGRWTFFGERGEVSRTEYYEAGELVPEPTAPGAPSGDGGPGAGQGED